MRLRNVKNKEQILAACPYLIKKPQDHRGKWHQVFNNDHPIYLEIGIGKGQFIRENAKRYKDINFIGIEKFDNVLTRAIGNTEPLPNLRFLRLDAIMIAEVFDHEIDRLYLNFSDPWPKSRHAFRRLTSPIFLSRYENIFRKDKQIEMKTDNQDLFTYSIETLSQKGYGLIFVSLNYHQEAQNIIMSEYEQKFVTLNQPIFYLFAKK